MRTNDEIGGRRKGYPSEAFEVKIPRLGLEINVRAKSDHAGSYGSSRCERRLRIACAIISGSFAKLMGWRPSDVNCAERLRPTMGHYANLLRAALMASVVPVAIAGAAVAGPLEDVYRIGADKGEAGAQFSLGFMYQKGLGVPQDHLRAYMWFDLAAAQGTKGAAEWREHIAGRMTPEQIAEAQKLAREWKPKLER
jgi:Sel1 repeat